MSIITLTTDFGIKDEYAGIIKGVMLSVNPAAVIIDITHNIEPQDLIQAAYIIKHSFKYFPVGTVHVVIVDPEVGSKRAIIALETRGHIFLVSPSQRLSRMRLYTYSMRNYGVVVQVHLRRGVARNTFPQDISNG